MRALDKTLVLDISHIAALYLTHTSALLSTPRMPGLGPQLSVWATLMGTLAASLAGSQGRR